MKGKLGCKWFAVEALSGAKNEMQEMPGEGKNDLIG